MHIRLSKIIKIIIFSCFCLLAQSCFTGVEGTGKINLSKKDEIILLPSEEESYLADCTPSTISEWSPGKAFYVTDEKFKILAESESYVPAAGDTIKYKSITSRIGADGSEKSTISFRHGGDVINLPLEKSLTIALNSVSANDSPFLLDLDMIDHVKNKLKGKTLWTKSALWYNDSLKYIKGKKFYPVTVTEILPGNSFFPILVNFKAANGLNGSLLMSLANINSDNRSFNRLFSLTDPRNTYKHISQANWEAIQNENLILGMTKEECRLSKGNPSETEGGHNYSNTMDIWLYPNGSYLRFVDGLLIDYK